MTRIVAAAALVALAIGSQQQPTFKTGTELVRVDVSVLDNRGRPVLNLSANDFSVTEDGFAQTIQTFKMLELTGAPAPGDDLTLTIGPRDHRQHELARDDVRMFVIFWDEFHIAPDPPGRLLREDLVAFIRRGFGPTDFVAVMDPWTPMSDLSFTRDRYRLAADVSVRRGRRGVYVPPRNLAEENHLMIREGPEWARSQVAVSALTSACLYLGTLRESRKAILYVGEEFGLGRDTHGATESVIEAANASNVAVYSINPVGLRVSGPNMRTGMLANIAHNTGGESFLSNSPAMALGRATTQSTVSYLLGYVPTPPRPDGKFHKIKVSVKGGFQVRARNGYWAPDAAGKEKARKEAADAVLPGHIDEAFSELVRLGRPESEAVERDVRTIMLPEEPSPALAVSPPRLWRVQRPADLQPALNGTQPPHAGREFTRGERIVGRISLEGEQAAGAALSISLIDRRGKRLIELPFTRTTDGATLDLPLQSIARGDYLIAIEAQQGDHRAAAYVPIRINDR